MGDVIVAVSSAQGSSALSIVRLSGEDAIGIASSVVGGKIPKEGFRFTDVELSLGRFCFPARVLVFRAPHSYTREDVVEFQTTGLFVCSVLMDGLIKAGARVAEPGEFTRRAFENGRISLAQAEAVDALVRARDEAERRESIRLLTGETDRRFEQLRKELTDLLGLVEAELDFSDQDITLMDRNEFLRSLRRLMRRVKALRIKGVTSASVPRVVLSGEPNVGKSTLFNALVGRERVVTDGKPGTTRDFVEETLAVGDVRFLLVDTAGENMPESRGGEGLVRTAALILAVHSADRLDEGTFRRSEDERVVAVVNKSDKGVPLWLKEKSSDVVVVSALYGYGLGELRRVIVKALRRGAEGDSFSATRRSSAISEATSELCGAYRLARLSSDKELVAFRLRNALASLYSLSEGDLTESMLDGIFARFCIGK